MPKKGGSYLCLSLTDETLKIAQTKGFGPSAKVINVLAKDVRGVSEADLPKIVQKALSGFKAKACVPICTVAPSMVTTKNIEIPSVNQEEIDSIVNLQAGRHTPFARDEIQIGYVKIGVYKNNYTKVLLVIANRNALKKQVGIFEKAGVRVKRIVFASEAMAQLYSGSLNLINDAAPTAFINIDQQATDFIISLRGAVIASRTIPIGRMLLNSDGPDAQNRLSEELGKTLESYQSEEIDELPVNYIFTSDDQATQMLSELLQQKYNWTVQRISYIDQIKMPGGIIKKISKNFLNVSFYDVFACGALADNLQVNLIPEEVQIKKSLEDQSKELMKTMVISLLILFFIAVGLGAKMYMANMFLSKLKTEYKDEKEEVRMLNETTATTQLVQEFLKTRMVSLDSIYELYKKVPKEVYLTGISMNPDGTVNIQGIADIASIVYDLGTALKDSEFFSSVEIKSTTSKKDRGKDVSAFEIVLGLKSEKNKAVSDSKKEEDVDASVY